MVNFAKYLLTGAVFACWASFANGKDVMKKIIVHSFDLRVTTDELVSHLDQLEKVPIDGISIFIDTGREEPCNPNFGSIMFEPKWEKEWFNQELDNLKKLSAGRLKHNFLFTKITSRRRLAWDDDESWNACAHNFGVMAWLAKEAGAKGLIVDVEDYHKKRQYKYMPDDGEYADVAALARSRGAQVMRAIGNEYPDSVLLFFWLLSLEPQLYQSTKASFANAEKTGTLWPHFVNGMLDVVPPEMKLIDGNENAYRFRADRMDFYPAAWNVAHEAVGLVSPENQLKYRTQVQVGFGLYLDSYVNDEASPWYFPELNGSKIKRFRSNLKQAVNVCNEYVWFCGEKRYLINWRDGVKKLRWNYLKDKNALTWEQALPGFEQTIAFVRNPTLELQHVSSQIQQGELTNLVQNPDCEPQTDENQSEEVNNSGHTELAPGWSYWQGNEADGKFSIDETHGFEDKHSAKVQGSIRGCFIVKVPVKQGTSYAVQGMGSGDGIKSLAVRWQQQGKWCSEGDDRTFYFEHNANDDWKKAMGIVSAPADVDVLVILLNVSQTESEIAHFDRVGVYELD